MTEADILAQTYGDLCGIYRPETVKLPTGETVHHKGLEGKLLATCVPCALSKPGGGKLNRSASAAAAPTEPVLFTRPGVDIQANDLLVVTHLGVTEAYYAGKPERQPSHNNVPLKPASDLV